MKTYSAPKWFWLLPALLVILVVYYFIQPYPLTAKIFMALLGLLSLYYTLSSPTHIEIDLNDRSITFQGVFYKARLTPEEITAIEKDSKKVVVKHRRGKIDVPYYIDGLEDFAAELKQLNPAILEETGPMLRLARSPGKIILLVIFTVITLVLLTLLILLRTTGRLS